MDIIYTLVKAPITKPTEMGADKKLLILANGPSANEFWKNEKQAEKFSSYDLMCMNHAIYTNKEDIFRFKPSFFILVDPVFWGKIPEGEGNRKEYYDRIKNNVNKVLEKIDWKAFIITNYHGNITFKNKNLTVIRLNRNKILPEKERYYKLYKKNLANPGMDTVLESAIFWGITFGYKEIALLGTEFSMFKDLIVDQNNIVYNCSKHFYEEKLEDLSVKAVTKGKFGFEGSAVAYYLHRISNCFSMFFELRKYADFYRCKIYNYTPDSMIDVFERRII